MLFLFVCFVSAPSRLVNDKRSITPFPVSQLLLLMHFWTKQVKSIGTCKEFYCLATFERWKVVSCFSIFSLSSWLMFMGSDIFEACFPAKLSFHVCKLFVWLALSFRPWAIWKISVGGLSPLSCIIPPFYLFFCIFGGSHDL